MQAKQELPEVMRSIAFGEDFLTTVCPTDKFGVGGNSGVKSAKEHRIPSGKG